MSHCSLHLCLVGFYSFQQFFKGFFFLSLLLSWQSIAMAEDSQDKTAKLFPLSKGSSATSSEAFFPKQNFPTSDVEDVDLQLSLGGIYNKSPPPTKVTVTNQESLWLTSLINEENKGEGGGETLESLKSATENPALQGALQFINKMDEISKKDKNVSHANQVAAGSQMEMGESSSGTKGKSVMTTDEALVHENPLQGDQDHCSEDEVIIYSREELMERMEKKPRVSTMGGNGEETRGFLWKYDATEGAVIFCVCHGKFFSAEEFVKHAGGAEDDDPMQKIKVVGLRSMPFELSTSQ